jgi:hypothetical protein
MLTFMNNVMKLVTQRVVELGNKIYINRTTNAVHDRLCGLVVRVSSYISRDPGLIPDATRFPEE